MFFKSQHLDQRCKYLEYLRIIGSLSNLFSESLIPYLYYRIAEKIFCLSFEAEDLSRSDISVDAKKGNLGIGLKTFSSKNNNSFQKVAEFNADRPIYENLQPRQLIEKVSKLRNIRLNFTEKAYELSNLIYHCIVREKGKFNIYEEVMDNIDINNIKHISKKRNSILFDDGKNEYSFLLAKSTLTKRFNSAQKIDSIKINILENPLIELQKFFKEGTLITQSEKIIKQTIYLPLYGNNLKVYPKSGLNQWNASGRPRNENEVYIPIPAEIHKYYPSFFPDRETPFNLKLPHGKTIQSKICQDGNKALMSKSNKELGEWILRKVLQLKEGELLTYEKLQSIGIDSVRIDKIDEESYEINFSSIGTYEEFRNNFLL